MKKIITVSIFVFAFHFLGYSQSIGINNDNASPETSAILDVKSTSKGLLVPRMTTVQRDAIIDPVMSLLIFNTDTKCYEGYDSDEGEWFAFGCLGSLGGGDFVTCGDNITFSYRGSTVTYGTVEGANNRCWLDRNLGASQVAASELDPLAFGDLFQWGRGDDGHQDRNSNTTNETSAMDNPGHSNFILNYANWREPKNDNLWQGVNGVNNPCPQGWRLPEFSEWETEMESWVSEDITGGFLSPLKLTAGGWRDNGSGGNIQYPEAGFYQTSSFLNSSPANGVAMFAVEDGFAGQSSNARSYGAYIRCIKD